MTKYKIRQTLAALLLATMMTACGNEDIHNGKTPIARVFDSYLYYEDLGELVPKGASSSDSTLLVQQYINVWVKQQLMIKKAELNLKPEEMDVQKQLEEYRNNLLMLHKNLPRSLRSSLVLGTRYLLDIGAALFYFLNAKKACAKAVRRAHREYRKLRGKRGNAPFLPAGVTRICLMRLGRMKGEKKFQYLRDYESRH